jgi:hypothetical protein
MAAPALARAIFVLVAGAGLESTPVLAQTVGDSGEYVAAI